MSLQIVDYLIILGFFVLLLSIGYFTGRKGGDDATDYFLSGRKMPWWILGISMVATTFANDTPTLVTDMVRIDGVASNWMWWSFLLTGMLTVFIYAKLWNRSKVMTDNEFYELRYSGKAATFLRGFRSIYLGFFYNVIVIAGSCLAFIKMAGILLGVNPATALVVSSIIIIVYSTIGGLKSILWAGLLEFTLSMGGAIIAAIYIVNSPEVSGLAGLLSHPNVSGKLDLLPSIDQPDIFLSVFLIPITIQWWAAWYPGSEPGGGGFIVQRMLSAKNEKHAVGATFFFNFMHYAVRPWPWILVALASLIVFPDLKSMENEFPGVDPYYVQNDIAYYAMLKRFLPVGILGLVVTSLISAYMSTVASLLNWGSSCLVNDVYKRFVNPNANGKRLVWVGRFSSGILMLCSVLLAVVLQNALQAFHYLLMIGAGTGLIYLLRWFWWRINALSELVAMIAAAFFSIIFIVLENVAQYNDDKSRIVVLGYEMAMAYWNVLKFTGIVFLTTASWLIVTLASKPTDEVTLRSFYSKIIPGGRGWKPVLDRAKAGGIELVKQKNLKWDVPTGLLCMVLGCVIIYSVLFSVGNYLYGKNLLGTIFLALALVSTIFFIRFWSRLTSLDNPN